MGTMFEKGQTKRYSRVAAFSDGGKTKKDTSEENKDNDSKSKSGGLFGGYKTRQEQLDAMGLSGGGLTKRNTKSNSSSTKAGGRMEPKKMMRKEVAFMKKNKAPKSMIAHEKAEMKGEKTKKTVKKYARGGGCETRGMTRGRFV